VKRGRWLRLLTATAGVLTVAAGLGALAAGSAKGRAYLKSSPVVRRLNSPVLRSFDAYLFNLRHDLLSPQQLGDEGPVGRVRLSDPMGLDRDRGGALFVGDRGGTGPGHVIWRFGPDGTARIIAGTGRRGAELEASDARKADLGSPQGLCVDPEGRVYFADSYNHVVLRVDPGGGLTRVAGVGRPGDSGDGGAATAAALNQPYDARLDGQGNLYIADFGNHRIRKVDRDGRITTLAGTGVPGYSGDGGPAAAAQLNGPYGVFADARHEVLIADSENHVVRQVDSTGTIRTIAGTGQRGLAGDGGPAIQAHLDSPQGLYADGSGTIYVDDEHNHQIRAIRPDGLIHRVAGSGARGSSPDGTLADGGALDDVENLVVTREGLILFTEAGNRLLRAIGSDGRLLTLAGQGPTGQRQ
jgi:sugar lactone lactonase YvrE